MPKILLCAIFISILFLPFARAESSNLPIGIWVTKDGKAHIDLKPCAEKLCGTIIWLGEPIDPETGALRLDYKNPDESLRSRPIVGLKILEMKADPEINGWRGTIYNGEDGNTYKSILRYEGNKVDVEGCVLFGLLCSSQQWQRLAE